MCGLLDNVYNVFNINVLIVLSFKDLRLMTRYLLITHRNASSLCIKSKIFELMESMKLVSTI